MCREISQIPEMNTCSEDELHRWFKTHNPIYTHIHTHFRQHSKLLCKLFSLCEHNKFHLLLSWHISEIIFSLNYTPGAVHCFLFLCFFCEQLIPTKITVSRNGTQTEIWSDSRAKKKMSAVCIVSFHFITHTLIHPQLSEPFGSCCWVREMTGSGGYKIIRFYQQCHERKMSEWNVFPCLCFVCSHCVNLKLSVVPDFVSHFKSESSIDCFLIGHQESSLSVPLLMSHMLNALLRNRHVEAHYISLVSLFLVYFLDAVCRDVQLIHKLLSSSKLCSKVLLHLILPWCVSLSHCLWPSSHCFCLSVVLSCSWLTKWNCRL